MTVKKRERRFERPSDNSKDLNEESDSGKVEDGEGNTKILLGTDLNALKEKERPLDLKDNGDVKVGKEIAPIALLNPQTTQENGELEHSSQLEAGELKKERGRSMEPTSECIGPTTVKLYLGGKSNFLIK